ncbi:MAG: sarcosine oxidase subunit alpha [Thermoprotei archaeon]|nr:MAG: sarcosine oxidase subunit alpha [Thermoprotei archaeon]
MIHNTADNLDLRIKDHPILEFKRNTPISFIFNGKKIIGYEGESIAAALWASGIKVFRKGATGPEGPFCMIGYCSGCLVEVNGRTHVRACQELVRPNIEVKSMDKLPKPLFRRHHLGDVEHVDLAVDLMVVGAGPAGLSAAIAAAENGLNVVVFDRHFRAGGQLIKQTHKFFGSGELFGGKRGFQIAGELLKRANELGIKVFLGTSVYGCFKGRVFGAVSSETSYVVKPKTVVVSTGAVERTLVFPGNTLPGVMGAGAAQTLMNEYGVKPGERAIVVGAGNVGLIVSYQLMQAGVKVLAIVEIRDEIGGWMVHAAKVRRIGIPILTRHTVVRAEGNNHVERVVVSMVDERYKPIPGSEKVFDVDLLLLAVGLTPESRLLAQMGAKMVWSSELGGYVPYRNRFMETSIPGVFVAGDASGIEEATTAILTGRVAGLSATMKVKGEDEVLIRERERVIELLEMTRQTRFSQRIVKGLEKVSLNVVQEEGIYHY